MKEQVTVAIPVFNGEKYIQEALQSIIDQTRKVDKIIVCDNQSTDETVNIVNRFIKDFKKWDIKLLINDSNIGNIRNYNKCMELCNTDYLLILSSDDRLKIDTIENQLNFFKEHPALALVGGGVDNINENGQIISRNKDLKDRIFRKGEILELVNSTYLWIQHSTVLLKTRFTNNIGYWDSKRIGGDERFWAQVLLEYPIALLGKALAEERSHTEQLGKKEHLRYREKILHFETNYEIANFESDPERVKEVQKHLKNWAASQSIVVSNSVWKNFGETHLATKYWFYGLRTKPDYYFKRYIYSKMKKVAKRILFVKKNINE